MHERVNDTVVKHPIINPVESFLEIGENKNFDGGSSSENIYFNISSRRSDKSHIENKSGSDINLDKMVKPSFDEVDDNAIDQLIVLIENNKSLQFKHEELFLTSKNEKPLTTLSDLTELGIINKQDIWKKGTTFKMSDRILSGLRKYKMSRRKMIKLQTFPGATISDMKFFSLPLLKKKSNKVIAHVGTITNDAPHFIPDEMFKNMKEFPLLIQKRVSPAKIIISSPVLCVDKANSDINSKKLISLLNSTDWNYVYDESIDEPHLNEYSLHVNRTGSINLAKNLTLKIRQF